jgi:hypothetical protein
MNADVIVAGHPFASIGMGDQMRSAMSALIAAHVEFRVFDVFRYAARSDPDHRNLVEDLETGELGGGIRIFHINGNEVEQILNHLAAGGHSFHDGYNVIVPAWELPYYPKPWIQLVEKFHEVWAISKFVKSMFARSNIVAHHVGQNVELPLRPLLSRKYFGIRESAFVILHFFDLSSFAARKNPDAVIALFDRLRAARPHDDIQLVLKVKDGDKEAKNWTANLKYGNDAIILRKPLSAYETHSLIWGCDCLVSLHRSEGFGRGTGEAMFLGRLAMATGWSGNLDYMSERNSLLVNYALAPTRPDAYPFAEGQYWAEPDLDHAFHLLAKVLDDPALGRRIAGIGRRDVITLSGARAVGLAQAARLDEIAKRMSAPS